MSIVVAGPESAYGVGGPRFVVWSYDDDGAERYWKEGVGWVEDLQAATVMDTNTALAMPGWLKRDEPELWAKNKGKYVQPRPVKEYR